MKLLLAFSLLSFSVGGGGIATTQAKRLIAVSAQTYGPLSEGKVNAYSTDGQLVQTWQGSANEIFGTAVSVPGDVNRDGYDDVLVGAVAPLGPGKAYLFSGKDGKTLFTWQGNPSTESDHFGFGLSGVGDLNADGWIDLAVGQTGYYEIVPPVIYPSIGKVYVYSGRDGSLLASWTGENANGQFGWSIAGAGDVDLDGHADVLVGAKCWDALGEFWNCQGKAYLYSGRTHQVLYSWEGSTKEDNLGTSVAGPGDTNRDGYPDLLLGAYGVPGPGAGNPQGAAYLRSGKDGSLLRAWSGTSFAGVFGSSVSGAGDVDGDGYRDILVGEPQFSSIPQSYQVGKVHLFSGKDGSTIHSWTGIQNGDELGFSVSGFFDINHDGVPELLFGMPQPVMQGSGFAALIDGASKMPLQIWTGEESGSKFGGSVSGAMR